MTITEMQAIETEMVKEVVEICERNNITYFLHCGSALGAIRHQGPIPWDPDVDIIVPNNEIDNFCAAMRRELPEKYYLDYYETNKSYPCLFPRIGLRGYSTKILHADIFILTGMPSNKNDQIRTHKKAKLLKLVFYFKHEIENPFLPNYKKLIRYVIKLVLLPISRQWLINKFQNYCSKYPYNTAEYVSNLAGHYGTKNVLKKSIYGNGSVVKYGGFDVKIPEQYDSYLKHYYGDYLKLPPKTERNENNTYLIGEL